MSDSRPLPEYGEYATPEQQAAAMGRAYDPRPDPATPATPVGLPPESHAGSRPPAARANLIDRFVTIFQLGIGLTYLFVTDDFHAAESTNTLLATLGLSQRIPLGVDHLGWLILTLNIVFLLLTFAWAYVNLRRGHLAFYIPAVGYLIFSVVAAVVVRVLV